MTTSMISWSSAPSTGAVLEKFQASVAQPGASMLSKVKLSPATSCKEKLEIAISFPPWLVLLNTKEESEISSAPSKRTSTESMVPTCTRMVLRCKSLLMTKSSVLATPTRSPLQQPMAQNCG